MLTRKTVFVLGAGSSVDFGIGAGDALSKAIIKRVSFRFEYGSQKDGDIELMEALTERVQDRRKGYFEAGALMKSGLPASRSIDEFLYAFGDNPLVVELGKASIVRSILDAEARSHLKLQGGRQVLDVTEVHRLSSSWIYRLFGHMQTDVRRNELERLFENIVVVNFNYDRCVEHFFYNAIRATYSIPPAEAAKIMQHLKIEHPYGRVGRLPWQLGNEAVVEFGSQDQFNSIKPLATEIKTFTEQRHSDAELESWRGPLRDADQVVFLGFAFHKQNVDLLRCLGKTNPVQAIATSYGASDSDREVFDERIRASLGEVNIPEGQIMTPNMTASDCLLNYGLRIAS